jgi:hypothetical protein
MNSQEIRALQEAYSQVYSEGSFDNLIDTGARVIKKPVQDYANKKIGGLSGTLGIPGAVAGQRVDQTASDLKKGNYGKALNTVVSGVRTLTQSYDLYDIILSHLLDEGYAETLEQAEVIMVNMSEDWRESIMEISQKTATNAFATRATGEFEYDTNPSDYTKSGKSKADEGKRRIEKKFGKKAGAHAERAAHARIFGRKGAGGMPSAD